MIVMALGRMSEVQIPTPRNEEVGVGQGSFTINFMDLQLRLCSIKLVQSLRKSFIVIDLAIWYSGLLLQQLGPNPAGYKIFLH